MIFEMLFFPTPSSVAPMSSISSMEVNVDMLEQMDLLDISDQDALDVFLASTEEDDECSCPLEGSNGQLTIRNQIIF